jgi:hypothetical protein
MLNCRPIHLSTAPKARLLVSGIQSLCSSPCRQKSPCCLPGHLRKPVGFLPSLTKIIVTADVFIHLLKQLLQSLWRLSGKILGSRTWTKPLDHGLNDNFIGHCRRLCSQAQEPSDVCLEILLMVLRALKQGLSCDCLCLKALETCHQHVLKLLS